VEARIKSESWGYCRPFFENELDQEVAQAVINFDPGRTLGIWKKAAESAIDVKKRKGYRKAEGIFANIRDLMIKLKMEKEWQEYLASLRSVHKRKYFLMQLLDKL
jgi:uncharacterized Zn finger protein